MMLRVVQVGLGPIGLGAAARCLARPDVAVVAAVDPHPDKANRLLSELLMEAEIPCSPEGMAKANNVRVAATLPEALDGLDDGPTIAIHSTSSLLSKVYDQLLELVAHKLNVISTCEQLFYPWFHFPEKAAQLDRAAQEAGVSIVATGVNPGYVMDVVPLILSGVSTSVEAIDVHRVVDAGVRRGPLQAKVGAGLSVDEFLKRKDAIEFGHVGLEQSAAFLAAAFGWELDKINVKIGPEIAQTVVDTKFAHIEQGHVLGIDHTAIALDTNGKERIHLHLQIYVNALNPRDVIRLYGTPPLVVKVPRGIPGDGGTVSALINTLPHIEDARPGLRTMLDMPLPRLFPAKA